MTSRAVTRSAAFLAALAAHAVGQVAGVDCGPFSHVREITASRPALALECAAALRSPAQREWVLREAFTAAMRSDPEAAARHAARLLDRPWVADAGFFPVPRVISLLARSDPGAARRLMLIAARRFPGVALREAESITDQAVFDAAAASAPDEAVGLAAGKGQTAVAITARLSSSTDPTVRRIAALATGTAKPLWIREREAVFCRRAAAPGNIESNEQFFSAVAAARINAADDDEAALCDRVLERTAQIMFHDRDEAMRRMNARDAYLAIAYGRTEQDDESFNAVFDSALLPKLRRGRVGDVFESAGNLRLRQFLAAAAAHHRLDSFENADVLSRCFKGLDQSARPIDEALAAAVVLEEVRNPRVMQPALIAEFNRAVQEQSAEGPPIYGLLAASLARRIGVANASPALRAIAERYATFFVEPRKLDASALFDANGTALEQHFFYDDDDGVESFTSFRKAYASDPKWKWQDRGAYIRLTATGAGGRRIEILANVPDAAKLGAPSDDDSRHALARMLISQGRAPSVVVHRGHAYFVERTVRYLPGSARLIYLGSCRGHENIYAVMSAATRAQVIATRAVGTLSVNDPLLKALNDELLRGGKTLDWEQFWRAQQQRFGSNAAFRDYIPPHRNGAAMLLAAYWECLAAE